MESMRSLVALPMLLLHVAAGQGPLGVETDCAMRALLLRHALSVQPALSSASRRHVFDSLELAHRCNATPPAPAPRGAAGSPPPAATPKGALVVDYARGDDGAPGTAARPLKTVARALELAAARKPAERAVALRAGTHFLAATLELTPRHSHLRLAAYCSGSGPCEQAWLSGSVALGALQWKQHNVSGGSNVWKASVSAAAVAAGAVGGASLHWLEDSEHTTVLDLARFPNRIPSTGTLDKPSLLDVMSRCDRACSSRWLACSSRDCLFADLCLLGVMSSTDAMWERAPALKAATTYVEQAPDLSIPRSVSHYANHWMSGVGGECARFDPPAGFICTNASGGGYGWDDLGPFFPVALSLHNASAMFPNLRNWGAGGEGVTAATITSWTNGWYTSTIPLASLERKAANTMLLFDVESWSPQGGRSWHFDISKGPAHLCTGNVRNTDCGPLKVEGLLAELDAPNEFYFSRKTSELYLFYNSSSSSSSGKADAKAAPPASRMLVVPALKELIAIRGSYGAGEPAAGPPTQAVLNVSISGLGFRDSATSVLAKHGIPSGGDWSLQRTAALFLEGTEGVTVSGCRFKYLGGIGYMVSGHNRDAQVLDSEFAFIGGSAAAGWGFTQSSKHEGVPAGVGVDGTDGNQPYRTRLARNVCREIGTVEKQSSCWFQAKTGNTTVEANLFFNGPRAHININDGFAGSNMIRRNGLWNSCRESGDHGAINTWDRLPYSTIVGGKATVFPLYSNVSRNFFISNYNSFDGIDNDDGSSYYDIASNVFYMGEGLKSDYRGHGKRYHDNLNIGAGVCCFQFGFITCPDDSWKSSCAEAQNVASNQFYQPGHVDHCYSNRCIQAPGGSWLHGAYAILWGCNKTQPQCHPQGNYAVMETHGNTVYRESYAQRPCAFGAANRSCDVACGGGSSAENMMSVEEFSAKCQGGSKHQPSKVVKKVPSAGQIERWACELLSIP